MRTNRVSLAVRRILLGTMAGCAVASPLLAADAAETDIEEIVVTGTRLRGADAGPVGSPLIALDRDAITASGAVTVDRILREIPQNFDLGVSENSRAQSGGAGNIVYGNTVNLRGIGPYATLVLVDGHRVTNNTRSTDPSIIPTLGVERIEVLADGASAIYGSDAIAGVVNVIPRRTLDGVEAFGRYGVADNPSFNEWVAGIAGGKVWDRGQIMLAYEHAERSNLSGDDRDFYTSDQRDSGGRDHRITQCNPGTLRINPTTTPVTYAIPAGGLTSANAGTLVAGTANRCDAMTGQDLFPEQSYNTANLTGTFDFNDMFTAFGDAFYSKREFLRTPAYTTVTVTVPQTNAWFVRPPGFTGTSYQVDYSFIQDLPRNFSEGHAENWQVTPGLRMHLPQGWQVEALIGYGETDDDSSSYYGTNNAALTAALASNDPATAFDPYGLNRTSQSVRDLIGNQVFLAPTKSDFLLYELRADGKLFEMPGGEVGLAVGLERQEIGVDLGSARGNPGTPIAWRHFERDVNSAYAEVLIPLFGPANERAGLHRLQLSAAVRYDDYSDVGDTTNPKLGISWEPISSLNVRASWGTSFRAPLITQIYGNSNNLFNQNYANPAGGLLPGTALSGENRDLGPEEATTWSAGFDWKPMSNLQFSFTYFDVEYENQVEGYLGNLGILSQEASFAGTGIILRGTEARDRVLQLLAEGVTVGAGTFPGNNPNNVTLFVDGRAQNLGLSLTQGLDFQGMYALDTASAGTFTFSASGTYLFKHEVAITAIAPLVDRLNTIFNPLEFKLRAGVDWQLGAARASVVAQHVNGYTNTAITPSENVGSYTPVDVAFSWNFGDSSWSPLDDLVVGFEVRNAFDEDPPYVNIAPTANGSGGYDATASNPVGRLFAVSLRKKW